jgi:MFS family permease
VATSRKYWLAVLTAIMAFNYIDRIAMGLMLQDIKVDLHLSDTQLGVLTGIAFALFYSVMGIPIARWADRGNRVTIITVTIALWSGAVALCALAAGFWQLLIMRVGVAVGEAGCHPPAFSLIADYYTRAERPRAVARYMLGWPLALLVGYFAAGWLNEAYGWRATFVILGAPGFGLVLLAALVLKEPRSVRGGQAALASGPREGLSVGASQPKLMEVLRTLWASTAYRHLLIAFSLSYFFGNGMLQWQPAFFRRSFGIHPGEIGTWFALIYGLGGLLGTYAGGEWAARYAANKERLQFLGLAALYAAWALLSLGTYLVPDYRWALAILALSAIGNAAVTGPMFAATQTLVPPHMRAMSIAIILFCSNLIGLGLGPLAVGALSDVLQPRSGVESLRYSLMAMSPGYLWCAWHLWRASQTIESNVAAVTDERKCVQAVESGAAE